MSADINLDTIEPGMPVFTTAGEDLGTVEGINERGIRVRGQEVPRGMIDHVGEDGVRLAVTSAGFSALREAASASAAAVRQPQERDGALVIPVVEERVAVGTREADLGEIVIRKRIVEEQRMVPVVVRREEVEVLRRQPGDPPIPDTAEPGVEVIRIPVRGQEAVVGTQAFVTREIVVTKDVVTEEREVAATVRRERVDVDENYRTGRAAAVDARYRGRRFDEVEPDLRREHEARLVGGGHGASWEQLREEIRAGFQEAQGA